MHLSALAGESAEDAPLGHLQAGGDGRDSGERGGQSSHVGLHVAQQLLQLVQHCDEGGDRKETPGGWEVLLFKTVNETKSDQFKTKWLLFEACSADILHRSFRNKIYWFKRIAQTV